MEKQYLYVKQLSFPIHRMNFMVEVRKNVTVHWMGQLSYVGALTKSKLCQLLKYSAHADFLVTNFKTNCAII